MVSVGAVALFGLFWTVLWQSHKGAAYIYFDPQDAVHAGNGKRSFRRSAASASATFEPMLKHYIGVTQLLVTVAAASIAFGGDKNPAPALLIVVAKLLLAWSICYGVLFCAFVLYRYDEYSQDVKCYTRAWYSTVEAFGFATLACFTLGYLAWGWGLAK
jgi:hypothetical protein